jgi:S1-C subfamily serine protease
LWGLTFGSVVEWNMDVGSGRCIRAKIARLISIVFLLPCLLLVDFRAASGAEPAPKGLYHASVVNGDILGSAFMISDGMVVTNAHVVVGRRAGQKIKLISPSGKRFTARVEAVSKQMDLAILSVPNNTLRVVPAVGRHAQRGARVSAVGIVADSGNPGQRYTVQGIVSSEARELAPFGRGVIANMPHVRKGFSGGPVFDGNGGFVGMVAALRPAQVSPSGNREAFILLAADIHAEIARLTIR